MPTARFFSHMAVEKAPKPRGLLRVTQEEMRIRHFSRFTKKNYPGWIRRYIAFHSKQHPRDVGPEGIKTYLSCLASHRNVAPVIQNQALNALVFLYREVLGLQIGELKEVSWAEQQKNIPVVRFKTNESSHHDQRYQER